MDLVLRFLIKDSPSVSICTTVISSEGPYDYEPDLNNVHRTYNLI